MHAYKWYNFVFAWELNRGHSILGSLKINMKLISQKNNYTTVVHIADIMLYNTVIIAIKYYCDFGDLEGASVAQA